jgi:hypothetical protein
MSRHMGFAVVAFGACAAVVLAPAHPCRADWGGASATETKIYEALKAPTEFEFVDTPLQDVIAALKEFHKIPIQLDKKALQDVGVPADVPITKSLKGITLRSALRLMLRDLDLTYVVRDDVLLITTPEEAENMTYVRVYPVDDLVGDAGAERSAQCETLVKAVTTCIAPEAWSGVGGPGSISTIPPGLPRALVVDQYQQVHDEIDDFLGMLRQAAEKQAQGVFEPIGGATNAAEKKIFEELKAPTDFEFVDTPLQDVIRALAESHKIEIQIDHKALDDVGVPPDVSVTISLRGVPLASALRLLLHELDLTYVVRDEVLLITTPEEAENMLVTWVYPLNGLVAGRAEASETKDGYAGALVKTITTTIAPESWDDVGGPGSLTVVRLGKLEALVVMQTQFVQEQIAGLLARPEFR